MCTIINRLIKTVPPNGSKPGTPTPTAAKGESILFHLATAVIYRAVSVVILGIIYPLRQADRLGDHRSAVHQTGVLPRPSLAAGKNGYDPTSTGGTEFGIDEQEAHRRD